MDMDTSESSLDKESEPQYTTAVIKPPGKDGTWIAALYKDGKPHGVVHVGSLSSLLGLQVR
jgi:hypothetical protein